MPRWVLTVGRELKVAVPGAVMDDTVLCLFYYTLSTPLLKKREGFIYESGLIEAHHKWIRV